MTKAAGALTCSIADRGIELQVKRCTLRNATCLVVTKELLEVYPSGLASYMDHSLSDRHKVVMECVPKMAKEAAEEAMDRNVVVPSKTLPHIVFATGMESVEEYGISDDRRGHAMAVVGARG